MISFQAFHGAKRQFRLRRISGRPQFFHPEEQTLDDCRRTRRGLEFRSAEQPPRWTLPFEKRCAHSRSGLASGADVGGSTAGADLDDDGPAPGARFSFSVSHLKLLEATRLVVKVAFIDQPAEIGRVLQLLPNGLIQPSLLAFVEAGDLTQGMEFGSEENVLHGY